MPIRDEIKVKDILKNKKQILLMKNLIDGILEPTEEETKYKEKHGKDMALPKSFQGEDGSIQEWENYENSFQELSKALGGLQSYYEKSGYLPMDDYQKNWDKFRDILQNVFKGMRTKIHEKYAVGGGEFDALTNPRVRRLVAMSDAITDIEGLCEALYERETMKKIQEKALAIRIPQKEYLKDKKSFADEYTGSTISRHASDVVTRENENDNLESKNIGLRNQLNKMEGAVNTSKDKIQQLNNKKKELLKKKEEFDKIREEKLKKQSTMAAYQERAKLKVEIKSARESIETLQDEKNSMSRFLEEYRNKRVELFNAFLNSKDKLAKKYKKMTDEKQILETIIQDTELTDKYSELAQAAFGELSALNNQKDVHADPEALIEKTEESVKKMEDKLLECERIIEKNKLPQYEHSTASELKAAKKDLYEWDKNQDVKNINTQLTEIENEINTTNISLKEQQSKVIQFKNQISYNENEIATNNKHIEVGKNVEERAMIAKEHRFKLQKNKNEFVESMKDFKSGDNAVRRVLNKARVYDLKEGTRWGHKNTVEFNTMDNALQAVKDCDGKDKQELKNRLVALKDAAEAYRAKKLKDGGWNTGMRHTRLTKAQSLINMCELGIQQIAAVSEKKEKALVEFKDKIEAGLQKKAQQRSQDKMTDQQVVEEKLNKAHEGKGKYDTKLETAQKKFEELETIMMEEEEFSR